MEKETLKKLSAKFPCQRKIQTTYSAGESTSNNKAMCVAYIDARDVMNVLDEVFGPGGRQDVYESTGKYLICKIGAKIDNERVWKSDTSGSGGGEDEEKSTASGAFKRAAVKWGIGRFTYDMPRVNVDYKETQPASQGKKAKGYPISIDSAGNSNRIYDLSKHINDLLDKQAKNAPR